MLKRNSGFIVGCMITAGVSFFAADIVMSQKMDVFTALFESEDDPIVINETNPALEPETEITRTYETDAFTITASGTVIKGVETEPVTEKPESDTPETEDSGNPTGEGSTGKTGTSTETGDSSNGDSSGNSGSGTDGYYGDTSYNDGSYEDGSYNDNSYNDNSYNDNSYNDNSYNDNSYNDNSYNDDSYNDNWYDGPNIEIEDSSNGDHYYDDSWSDSGNNSGGGSDLIVEGEPADILLPGITTRYITESELYNFSDSMIRFVRNEIFALHGRIFKSEDLREYFMSKSWYTPMYAPEDFDACMFSILNKYEIANLEVILAYEEAIWAAN